MTATTADHSYMMLVSDVAPAWGISPQGAHKFLKDNDFLPIIVGKRAFLPAVEARAAMQARGIEVKKQVVCVQMLKGGVGKTTTALNIGIRASMYGARVLLVDLDQQGNLSFALGVEDESAPVWADLLEGRHSIESLVREITPTLHLIASNLNNSVLDKILLTGKKNVATGISLPLSAIRDNYDIVILDTAPNLSAINTAAACASDCALLPVNPDKFSFDGLQKTVADLDDIREEFRARFETKVLFAKFDGRETASHALLKLCLAQFGDIMLKGFIRTSSDLKNTIRSGQNIFSSRGTAKEDYDIVTRELLGLVH